MVKFEAKLKRRDADIREKTLELRKLRADAANAKLQVGIPFHLLHLSSIYMVPYSTTSCLFGLPHI